MTFETVVEIGGGPVLLRLRDVELQNFINNRYANYITAAPSASPYELTVEVGRPARLDAEWRDGRWMFKRSNFEADWSPETRRGEVRLAGDGLDSIDSVLRILHSTMVVRDGGCLFHAASAIRNGKAFLFPGVSTAGKSTISKLAPRDVSILSDEISYLRPMGECYRAFGTPFAGSLGKRGDNISAPLAAIYLLAKGPENRIDPLTRKEAISAVMRNILFFANDADLMGELFETACRLVTRVPVYRLTFLPTPEVWGIIQ